LDHPAAGAAIGYKRWRRWRVRRTPYLLIYEPVAGGLRIVRIRHEREDWLVEP
ncbi:type II toxin-antitoxin system RelE/ParE family toxin, partial [Acinetobacter baumannii]